MTAAPAPAPCQGFGTMPIAGEWRPGRSGRTGADTDPWSGDTLLELPLASADDLDAAFRGASGAQRQWTAQPPAARAGVMRAAAGVLPARKAEVPGGGLGGAPGGPAGLLLPPHVLLAGNDVTTAREEAPGRRASAVSAARRRPRSSPPATG